MPLLRGPKHGIGLLALFSVAAAQCDHNLRGNCNKKEENETKPIDVHALVWSIVFAVMVLITVIAVFVLIFFLARWVIRRDQVIEMWASAEVKMSDMQVAHLKKKAHHAQKKTKQNVKRKALKEHQDDGNAAAAIEEAEAQHVIEEIEDETLKQVTQQMIAQRLLKKKASTSQAVVTADALEGIDVAEAVDVVSVAQPEAVAAGHVLDGGGDAVATPFTVDAIGGEEEVVDANDVVTIV